MTIAAVRAAIATKLDTIAGLKVSAYEVDSVVPPHAQVMRRELEYDKVQQTGTYDGVFVVRVFSSRTAEKASLVFLDGLCEPTGASSVKGVLEADATLGGAVSDCWVRAVSEPQPVEVGGVEMMAVDFDLLLVI